MKILLTLFVAFLSIALLIFIVTVSSLLCNYDFVHTSRPSLAYSFNLNAFVQAITLRVKSAHEFFYC